jgi:Protein of unknown function (DUF2924)
MSTYIKDQIDQLAGLSRTELLQRWQDLYGRAAPSGIRRELLIPFLAYRIQESAYGGLSSKTRALLKSAQRDLENARKPGARPQQKPMKVGTQFLRQWGGEMRVVSVTDAGFEYRSKNYRSLSEIARLITGTRWSGPAFFGLKKSSQLTLKKNVKRPD